MTVPPGPGGAGVRVVRHASGNHAKTRTREPCARQLWRAADALFNLFVGEVIDGF
jgi:hypothetical protein